MDLAGDIWMTATLPAAGDVRGRHGEAAVVPLGGHEPAGGGAVPERLPDVRPLQVRSIASGGTIDLSSLLLSFTLIRSPVAFSPLFPIQVAVSLYKCYAFLHACAGQLLPHTCGTRTALPAQPYQQATPIDASKTASSLGTRLDPA